MKYSEDNPFYFSIERYLKLGKIKKFFKSDAAGKTWKLLCGMFRILKYGGQTSDFPLNYFVKG